MMPSFVEEKKLHRKGYKKIAGLDEAGRGPLAGPVVACAVSIRGPKPRIRNIKDSKQLTAKQREEIYGELIKHPGVDWGVGIVSERMIDKINIFEATKLAMAKAVNDLHSKADFLILDGNFKIRSNIPQKPIIKADNKVFSCSCASIIAKVTRDRLMERYDKKYPVYCFASHKGYPTKLHRAMIKKYGPSAIHRKSFTLI